MTTSNFIIDQLRDRMPFSSIPVDQLERLLKSARLESAPAETILLRQGDRDSDFLVLIDGELEVRRRFRSPEGIEELDVGRVFPGQSIGEFALLLGVPRQATVVAVESSTVLRLDGVSMEETIAWSQRFEHELREMAVVRARMNLVRQVGPFRRLPLERVRMAFERMDPVEFDAGTVVVREGGPGDRFFVIETGNAEVSRLDPDSGTVVRVATLGPGDGFGEEALLSDGARNATVTLTTRARLLSLKREEFDLLMRPLMVTEIGASEAREMVENGNAEWIDCRFAIEFQEQHIPGARHLPLDRIRELGAGLDPDRRYIVYCRSGRRSVAAAFLLRERGFSAYSLAGGIRDWPYALSGLSVGQVFGATR